MNQFFKKTVRFIKNHPGILYSLLLLIFIPLVLYYNTYFVIQAFQSNIDLTIQNKVILVENILGVFLADNFEDPEFIQEEITKITQQIPEIIGLRFLKEDERGEFLVIASQNDSEIGERTADPSFVLAYSQDQSVAQIVSEKGERAWNVVYPFYYQGEKKGLISMGISLKESDLFLEKTVAKSYLIVIAAIMLSLLLIIQHTRLFGYVSLSRRLQEVDKMKDNFIRMATHELQSPIVNIRGHLNVLREEIKNLDQKQEELFFRADVSAKNLTELINDILEVSRIEQRRLDFSPERINCNQLIAEVIEDLMPKIKEKNLEIEELFPLESVFIKANSNRFKQIINNLVYNAIKYTFEGKITVKIIKDESEKLCYISVSDTGIGISAQAQERMFERFYRVKARETSGIPGTGLGLWISKQMTEKMGGKIYFESMSGAGSKFVIVFPFAN